MSELSPAGSGRCRLSSPHLPATEDVPIPLGVRGAGREEPLQLTVKPDSRLAFLHEVVSPLPPHALMLSLLFQATYDLH